MVQVPDAFRFDYFGSDLVYGRGSIADLGGHLAEHGLGDALVVCGSNTGANDALMGPIEDGLGGRLVGVFDGTTPAKAAEEVDAGIDAMDEVDPDVLVGVGGGSSLDVARQMSAFRADGRPIEAFREAAREGRDESPEPADDRVPVVVVPTTFAGADISEGGSIRFLTAEASPTGQPIRIRGSSMPIAMVYDPDLFETTPEGPLARSAMNGFDKPLETVYANTATPHTDATAVHALRHLHAGLPALSTGDPVAMERAVIGIVLGQFRRRANVIHSVGHAFSARYPIQQGVIHAVMAPHVLRYVLSKVDANRDLLAEGLGVDAAGLDEDGTADAVVDAVVSVRDSFDLPRRLRALEPVERADFPALAAFAVEDYMMADAPAGLDATAGEIEAVFEAAW